MESGDFYELSIGDDDNAVWWQLCGPPGEDAYDVLVGDASPSQLGVELAPMYGQRLRDANGSDGWIFTLSQRALDALSGSGVSGWSVAPVPTTIPGDGPESLSALQVTGRAAGIDYSNTSINPPGSTWGKGFGIRGWDGSDLFLVEGKAYLLCSRRFREVAEAAELSNFNFKPCADVEFPLPPEIRDTQPS